MQNIINMVILKIVIQSYTETSKNDPNNQKSPGVLVLTAPEEMPIVHGHGNQGHNLQVFYKQKSFYSIGVQFEGTNCNSLIITSTMCFFNKQYLFLSINYCLILQ